ncbi:MAG: head GIN domain-containing protein [Bacteroidota bacterium]
MKSRVISGFLLLTILVTGCSFWGVRGSGKLKSEARKVGDFSKVDASGAFTVNVKVGPPPSIKIQAEDNLLPLIKTYIRGNSLIIDTKKNISPRKEIKIYITTDQLDGIECSGANDIKADGIKSRDFSVELSGAGNIDLYGECEKVHAEISGAGHIDAKHLKSDHVFISVSGAASASVYASKYLDASVSGVGSIEYYGDPKETNTNVSGVGSITRK